MRIALCSKGKCINESKEKDVKRADGEEKRMRIVAYAFLRGFS